MAFGLTPGVIAAAVAEELPKIFDDAVNRARDGGPSTIKDGTPTSIPGRVGQAVARSACRRYGANPDSVPASRVERIEAACRPYLDGLNPDSGPAIVVPVEGGQCDQRCYGVDITTTSVPGGPSVTNRVRIKGPITGFRRVPTSPLNHNVEAFSRSVGQSGFNCRQTTPQQWNFSGIGGQVETFSAVIVDANMGGDVCGNAPPVVVPPTSNPDTTPPPFRFNPDPFIDIDVDVEVTNEGDIIFDIGNGPTTVDPFPPGDSSDGGAPGPGPGDIGDAGSVGDTGTGGEAEGEAPAGEILVGLKIDVIESPPKARQFVDGVFRGAVYIYMGVAENLDQDYGGSMLKSGQFFFAEKDNLTHWLVSANNGYRFNVTPYYREAQE